jgi:hypothetical protein
MKRRLAFDAAKAALAASTSPAVRDVLLTVNLIGDPATPNPLERHLEPLPDATDRARFYGIS